MSVLGHAQQTVVSTSAATTSTVTNASAKNVYKDIKLKVPFYKQPYANSCEATSLRMALAYKGIIKHEIQILTQFTYNPVVKDWINNIWDDPQKQFVGHVDVSGRPNGGYGVYGLPVVKAAESFGKKATYATGTAITAQFLAEAIDMKNPVLIWGYTSLTEPAYTWTTREGVIVKAVRGEHVRVVVGFKGTLANPVGFYVHDPFTGKANEYWTAAKLIDHIQKVPGVTDQAVVVK
jgi:uncharacterized protein YvpB